MWEVFSVKTLYRTSTVGEPKVLGQNYKEDFDLIEERIVTVKARNFDEAISKGEREATKYASETEYDNPYGQKVIQKYIGSIDAYRLFETIDANIELFSSTFVIEKRVSNTKITNDLMGTIYDNENEIRTKFLNSEFSKIMKEH
jgi:hypothetical protein